VLANAKNSLWPGRSRNYGTRCRGVRRAGVLQALWGALPPLRVRRRRALYDGRAHQNGDGGSGEAWLHIEDEAVSAVRHEDVFGGERADGRCAYMLFYCRTAPTQAGPI
jgi:hypothetical protein